MPTYTIDPNTRSEVYETDNAGNQIILNRRYAKDASGNFFYPVNAHGHQYLIDGNIYIEMNGEKILPLDVDGIPQYPTDIHGEAFYLKNQNNKYVIGKGRDGHQYYAKYIGGDEFYPPDGMFGKNIDNSINTEVFAKMKDGTLKYTLSFDSKTIFPRDIQNNEYYLNRVDINNSYTIPTTYAMDKDGNEFYPKTLTTDNLESDAILNDKYAKNNLNKPFYPQDAFNNEFYISTKHLKRPIAGIDLLIQGRYAVTNDLKIIVPNIANQPEFSASNIPPTLNNNHIVGQIIRENHSVSDYLTLETYGHLKKRAGKKYRYRLKQNFVIREVDPLPQAPPAAAPTANPPTANPPTGIKPTPPLLTSIIEWLKNKWYYGLALLLLIYLFVISVQQKRTHYRIHVQ